jgi:hypothetical protein
MEAQTQACQTARDPADETKDAESDRTDQNTAADRQKEPLHDPTGAVARQDWYIDKVSTRAQR